MIISQLFRMMQGLTKREQQEVINEYRKSVEAGNARLRHELAKRDPRTALLHPKPE